MAQFKDLRNGEGSERKIREVCTAGTMSVIVYEPSFSDVENLLEMQERIIEQTVEGEINVKVTEAQMIKEVFPLLTDLEGFEDLSDEEIEDITSNPSVALIQATNVITQIIIEVYKITILSIRQEMIEQDLAIEQFRFEQIAAEKIAANLGENGGVEEIQSKVKDAKKKLEVLQDQRHEIELAEIHKITQEYTPEKETKVTPIIPMNVDALEPGSETPEEIMKRFKETFDM